MFRHSRFQTEPLMVGFRCPMCHTRVDLNDVAETREDFMCGTCAEEIE